MAELVGEKGRVVSIDIQEEMLQMLKQKSEQMGLESLIQIHKSQPDKIGISGKVDFALAFYMIHEVPNQDEFLHEVVSLLKPKGKLLIVEPKFHVSASEFEKTLEAARSAGLIDIAKPDVWFSRSVLLEIGR